LRLGQALRAYVAVAFSLISALVIFSAAISVWSLPWAFLIKVFPLRFSLDTNIQSPKISNE
jgi:hypothetical protein